LLNGEPIITKGIFEDEFERLVIQAKNNKYVSSEQVTLQHSDFEIFERLIKNAIKLGKLRKQTLHTKA
jgi:hypothetical protein